LSTLFSYGDTAGSYRTRAILDAYGSVRRGQPAQRVYRALVLLLLLLIPLPNRAKPSSVRVRFRTVQATILVAGKVNGNAAAFLLDTGANRTIISTKAFGNTQLTWWPGTQGRVGLAGYSVRRPADLRLGEHLWVAQQVPVMDLEELKGMLKLDFDGLIGQDILRQFRSVRNDYRTHVIELEE
jgi:hypothetical protein